MRIGILGGTFDPPHNGHLLGAGDAYDALRLDRVLFIPAATQPLKVTRDTASAADRLAMVKCLVDGDARFNANAMEIERGGLSYTVDTLSVLAGELPGSTLFWLVGADVIATFAKWREPRRIVELATLAVLTRGEEPPDLGTIPGSPVVVEGRRIDISSTEIRRRVREGKSIRGFVPDSVEAYIASARLYR
ncbi:MAG: nicotinate-nucleotide adenylyltransferase [Gemmatimonadaceae bacterium]